MRKKTSIKEWKFSLLREELVDYAEAKEFNDSSWETVTIPHTWNNLDGQDGGDDYYRGIGCYRTTIYGEEQFKNKKVYIEFLGANIETNVYINGQHIGNHKGGFAKFRFDISDYIKLGEENVLVAKVDNTYNENIPPLTADFTFYGGLYREVALLITDKVHIDTMNYASNGVFVKQVDISQEQAICEVSSQIINEEKIPKKITLEVQIKDTKGNVIQEQSQLIIEAQSSIAFEQTYTIQKPRLWDGYNDPYRYTVEVTIKEGETTLDGVTEKVGFRYYHVDSDKGFYLNGKPYRLCGVSRHQDRRDKGWAISEQDHEEDLALIKEVGATSVRLAHYQQDEYFYDLCDEHGIVVWAEVGIVNGITASKEFEESCEQQLKELILQNYNHPSIMFWCICNEITNNTSPDPRPVIRNIAKLAKCLDDTRLTTIANSHANPGDELTNITDLIAFNRYYGWYNGTFEYLETWADTYHQEYPEHKFGISEYGAGANINYHSENSRTQDHTEEYQAIFHEENWKRIETRPFMWATYVWNMFDFAIDMRDEGGIKGLNNKGLVTHDRKIRKDSFYWYKANWSKEPFVHITSQRFFERKLREIQVKVYSNCEEVELIVNGTSLGKQKGEQKIFIFSNVCLKDGDNQIQAITTQQGVEYRDQCTWKKIDNDDTMLTSSSCPINNVDNTISNLPYGLKQGQLEEYISIPSGATIKVYTDEMNEIKDEDTLSVGMKLEVVAENQIDKRLYTISRTYLSAFKKVTTNNYMAIQLPYISPRALMPEEAVDPCKESMWIAFILDKSKEIWFTIDLGEEYSLERLDTTWIAMDDVKEGHQYQVYVSSDDEKYELVVDQTDNVKIKFTSDKLRGVSARYVKIFITKGIHTSHLALFGGIAGAVEFAVQGGLVTSETYQIKENTIYIKEEDTDKWLDKLCFAEGSTYELLEAKGKKELLLIVTGKQGKMKEGYSVKVTK